MAVFSFMPMLAFFNEEIGQVSKYIYSQQINDWISNLSDLEITNESMIILTANFLIALVLFVLLYRKKGLE